MSISPVSYQAQVRSTPEKLMGGADTAARESAATGTEQGLWGADGFTFGDLLDAINPLQQLPIVSTIYRHLTGDTISNGSRMIGGALMGGPIGLGVALANVVAEGATGKDLGETALAMITGDDAPSEVQVASAETGASSLAFEATPSAPPALPAAAPVALIPDASPADVTPLPAFQRSAAPDAFDLSALSSTAPPPANVASAAYQKAQILSLFDA